MAAIFAALRFAVFERVTDRDDLVAVGLRDTAEESGRAVGFNEYHWGTKSKDAQAPNILQRSHLK